MSETDGFIEEVSEEVRRDKVYGLMRRYGWIAVVAVVGLVGGAAYNEYAKAQKRNMAQARGDAILAALEVDAGTARAAELDAIADTGDAAPIVTMLKAAESLTGDDPDAAAQALQAIIDDAAAPQIYRDLAILKRAMLTAGDTSPTDRIGALTPLASPGGAFRVLAVEQIALAEIENGDIDAAVTRLRGLLEDAEASQGLRTRAQQLIVALGKEVEPA